MTKYGLLYYKDTDNIGDDIQSYAASRFLPHIDYMIDRENILNFVPDKKEKVKVIMNAWYIHDKYKFGISPFIEPLFISMHFKSFPYEDGLTLGTDYLTKSILDILKKFGPIGARDYNTQKILNDLKIDNYFSGCMTLTLPKFDDVKKGNYICAVNISKDELKILKAKTKKEIIEVNQDVKLKSLSNKSWEERKKVVEDLLRLYQGASFVVTTKLHCALPCLALETNVLVLYDKSFDDRMKTYKKYFNYVDRNSFSQVDIDKIQNTKEYLKLRNNLINSCQQFISMDLDNNDLLDIETYKKCNEIYSEKIELMKDNISFLGKKYRDECAKSDVITKKMNSQKKKIELLKNDNKNLRETIDNIYSSKSWKIASLFIKMKKVLTNKKT